MSCSGTSLSDDPFNAAMAETLPSGWEELSDDELKQIMASLDQKMIHILIKLIYFINSSAIA